MSESIEFFISGTPKSWKAPQFNRKTGSVYKGKQEKAWQESVWGQAMPYKPETPWAGPVFLNVTFFLPIPRSWPKWKQEMARLHKGYPMGKPDRTNLLKAFEDVLTGLFYRDDAQIVTGWVGKTYEDERGPGVAVALEKLPGLPDHKPKETQ